MPGAKKKAMKRMRGGKVVAKKMMGGGAAKKAMKRMRGGGAMKKKMMRGGGAMKKMMRGGKVRAK